MDGSRPVCTGGGPPCQTFPVARAAGKTKKLHLASMRAVERGHRQGKPAHAAELLASAAMAWRQAACRPDGLLLAQPRRRGGPAAPTGQPARSWMQGQQQSRPTAAKERKACSSSSWCRGARTPSESLTAASARRRSLPPPGTACTAASKLQWALPMPQGAAAAGCRPPARPGLGASPGCFPSSPLPRPPPSSHIADLGMGAHRQGSVGNAAGA